MKRPLVIVLIAILISSIIGFIDGMRVSMLPAEIHAFVLQNVTLTCDGYQNSSTCQLKFVIDRDRIADFPISSDLKAGSWQISARDQAVIDREDATAALTKFLFSSSVPALIISASAGSLATMIAKNQSVREMMASRIVVWIRRATPKQVLIGVLSAVSGYGASYLIARKTFRPKTNDPKVLKLLAVDSEWTRLPAQYYQERSEHLDLIVASLQKQADSREAELGKKAADNTLVERDRYALVRVEFLLALLKEKVVLDRIKEAGKKPALEQGDFRLLYHFEHFALVYSLY